MTSFMILLTGALASCGFVILHYALTHRTSELRVAGWTLVIGAVINCFFMFVWPDSSQLLTGPMPCLTSELPFALSPATVDGQVESHTRHPRVQR